MNREGNKVTFWSLDEFADTADARDDHSYGDDPEWAGASFNEALRLARKGWTDQLSTALSIAESAVDMAEKEHMVNSFNQPVWDVTGAQVDIGAFLAGTPECMIDYPLTETSKVGRVITLCASVSYSGSVYASTIQRRGQTMVALALALSKLGHSSELWADLSGGSGTGEFHIRVLVKSASDELDPARVMFAFAHPAMLRVLGFSAIFGMGKSTLVTPSAPVKDLPEGTIYLPEVCSDRDVPQAAAFLRKYLDEIGLLAE